MSRLAPSAARGVRRLRVLGAMIAAASLAGLLALTAGAPKASAADDSSMTVSWLNDHSAAAPYQPSRPSDDSSGKLSDFKNLQITVSQTSNLIDQAVTVTAKGMAATTGLGQLVAASNYLQVMQCWGDPLSPTFRQNCAFGAWGNTAFDNSAAANKLGAAGASTDTYVRPANVPFTTVYGTSSVPNPPLSGLEKFFNTSTGNEQDLAPIFDDGKGDGVNQTSISFNVQSGASAPWLGCGDTSYTNGTQCWLVVVPRGTHSGSSQGAASTAQCEPRARGDNGYGQVMGAQVGSPLDTNCTFWDDRVVVPLSFLPVGSKCPEGAPELSTNGSMLLNAAMSSWQGAVCAVTGGSVFNLINTAGLLTRKQLLQGTTKMAFIGQPVTDADDPDGQYLQTADIRYGPVANAAISIGFLVEKNTRVTDIKLTPRLVAKMLTQSYRMEVPSADSNFQVDYLSGNPLCITRDPEFIALNGALLSQLDTLCTQSSSGLIVSGPQGDDAIQLLWQWIESDKAAAKWLTGAPDENGMVVNPYYLPDSNPKAKGTDTGAKGLGPVDLSKGPVDVFYHADQTTWPSDYPGLSLDSIAWNPFSNDFGGVATRILNGDSQQAASTHADITQQPPALYKAAPEIAGSGLAMMGVTDQADVKQFGLDAAALQLPNKPNVFVAPTSESMEAAIGAQVAPEEKKPADGMATVDFSKLPNDAYPLTTTLYAAMNKNDSTTDLPTLARYLILAEYAANPGQVPGTERGQLPDGYAPLTFDQVKQNVTFEYAMLGLFDGEAAPPPDDDTPPDLGQVANGDGGGFPPVNESTGGGFVAAVNPPGSVPPAIAVSNDDGNASQSGSQSSASEAAPPKQAASSTSVGRIALGGSLGAGLVGMATAPLLMRRKAIT